jgi:hypothetical protein
VTSAYHLGKCGISPIGCRLTVANLVSDGNGPYTASQVKLLITNNAFCIVQRATAKSKTGFFCDYGVAEAPLGFQAGWSDCMYFFFSLFVHFVCSSRVSM